MPLTSAGKKVIANMEKQYGGEKGKQIFYASINKGKLKKSKMEGKKKKKKGKKKGKKKTTNY